MGDADVTVQKKVMAFKVTSKSNDAPRATLKDYTKSNLTREYIVVNRQVGVPNVLTLEIEKQFVKCCTLSTSNKQETIF